MVRKILEMFLSYLKVYFLDNQASLNVFIPLTQRYSKKKFPVDIIQRYTFKVNTCRLTLNTFFFTVDESKLTCFTCKYQRKCVPLTTKLI